MKTQTFAQAQRRYDAMEPPEDPYDDLDEMPDEELYTFLAMAEGAAEDPDVPARTRHKCDVAVGRLRAELNRRTVGRLRAEQETT
jgi:hypothetical protein